MVDTFAYLGSTLSRVVHIDDEVNTMIAKASAAFGRLCGCIWDRNRIRLNTRLIRGAANTIIRMRNLDRAGRGDMSIDLLSRLLI